MTAAAAAQDAYNRGDLDRAESLARDALADDTNADATLVLGFVAFRRGDFPQATRLIAHAGTRQPLGIDALDVLLESARRAGDDALVLATARTLCALDGRPHSALRLAVLEAAAGNLGAAFAAYDLAHARHPASPEPFAGRAGLLLVAGENDGALAAADAALARDPSHAEALHYRARALHALDRTDEALAMYAAARAAGVDRPGFWNNVALALYDAGRLDEALAHLDRACTDAPDSVEAQHNRAHVLLAMGRYAEGWDAYRWRVFRPGGYVARDLLAVVAPWNGERTDAVVVLHEQGAGDAIQFARYVPRVRARCAHLALVTTPALASLLRTVDGVDEVRTTVEIGAGERYAYIGDLPRIFATSAHAIPSAVPYVGVDTEFALQWDAATRAAAGGRLRIGLVWAGNPTHGNDRRRSLPFASLAPLLADARFAWFALQQGPRLADAEDALAAGRLLPLSIFTDFSETAAVTHALDLVVACDTSVAHLAGALGRPVWTLLATAPDWRWGFSGETTPWYPTMRLWRQRRAGDWDDVVARIHAALDVALTPR